MLSELRVSGLGVIREQTLLLGPGVTALTGETGAGKTMVVEAIGLLSGARADPTVVAPGAPEAVIEGRFEDGQGEERILRRVIPSKGRSRGYIDGHMASLGELAALGAQLVEIHGQHAHQALLSASGQRYALDVYADTDFSRLRSATEDLAEITSQEAALGGDERARAREMDLLRFQLGELDQAAIEDPEEESALAAERDRLAESETTRQALALVYAALEAEGGVQERIGEAVSSLSSLRASNDPDSELGALTARLRTAVAEVGDLSREARELGEAVIDDPARLEEINRRLKLLSDLRHKYGDTLAEVMEFHAGAADRLQELESHTARSAELVRRREQAGAELVAARAEITAGRRAAASEFSAAIEDRLHQLALAKAEFQVEVGEIGSGAEVVWLLSANPGSPPLPLTKVASGGELARTMLAARLVLTEAKGGRVPEDGAQTLIFDEVDAGIGGQTAGTVARALAALAPGYQVVVVTHLAQVAAVADRHAVVAKQTSGNRTSSGLTVVSGEERVAEIARMLSGHPDSESARRHASELIAESCSGSPRSAVRGGRAGSKRAQTRARTTREGGTRR